MGNKTAEYLKQGARVVAFEPEPLSFAKLQARFAAEPNVTVLPVAVAAEPGVRKLESCSKARTISTLDPAWKTGRFEKYLWDESVDVQMTTLDAAIEKYGVPQFIKIDVEGYEEEVLKGLSRKVAYLSFEFAGEFPERLMGCVKRLLDLGYYDFTVSFATEPQFAMEWGAWDRVVKAITEQGKTAWGDVYARAGNLIRNSEM